MMTIIILCINVYCVLLKSVSGYALVILYISIYVSLNDKVSLFLYAFSLISMCVISQS